MNYGKTIDIMCHIIAELWDEHMLHSLSCVNSFHSSIYDVRYKIVYSVMWHLMNYFLLCYWLWQAMIWDFIRNIKQYNCKKSHCWLSDFISYLIIRKFWFSFDWTKLTFLFRNAMGRTITTFFYIISSL